MIGQIQPHGVAHPLAVHDVAGDIVVYAVHRGVQTRVVTIRTDKAPAWGNGWFDGEPEARAAIVQAALSLREATGRGRS